MRRGLARQEALALHETHMPLHLSLLRVPPLYAHTRTHTRARTRVWARPLTSLDEAHVHTLTGMRSSALTHAHMSARTHT